MLNFDLLIFSPTLFVHLQCTTPSYFAFQKNCAQKRNCPERQLPIVIYQSITLVSSCFCKGVFLSSSFSTVSFSSFLAFSYSSLVRIITSPSSQINLLLCVVMLSPHIPLHPCFAGVCFRCHSSRYPASPSIFLIYSVYRCKTSSAGPLLSFSYELRLAI